MYDDSLKHNLSKTKTNNVVARRLVESLISGFERLAPSTLATNVCKLRL